MDDDEPTSDRRVLALSLAGFLAVALLIGVDVSADLAEGTTVGHVLMEVGVIGIGLVGAVLLVWRLVVITRMVRASRTEAASLAARLTQSEADAARWREESKDILKGLGAALDKQFERWALSPAEREVALLLLKGLSHKEIGEVRSIGEATARQQARAVYRKAGLTGRADLAAFFLEDLLPAVDERGAR